MNEAKDTRSTCPYCGVGCGLIIESVAGEIRGVRGDPEHPANAGRLCSKGATLHLTATPLIQRSRRLLQPAWRPERGAPAQAQRWDQTLPRLAERLAEIHRSHGPDAIGFYISGQLLTEDYHAFNKLARGLVGTNNIDSNSRLCMSSAVVGYKQSLGADAPPCCYEDIEQAGCVLISGANPAWAHPILFRRMEAARAARPEMKIIVVDPRRTESAEFADLHLQILPGSDVALCLGLLHACIWEGWIAEDFIAAHTEGFAALKELARGYTPREAARLCGIQEADLLTAARWFALSPASLSLYCQGLNQSSSGSDKNSALINLHLATAQIGRPGAGPFSLTGQPNAMGGREAGGMATLLPGHRDPADAAHRAEIAALWGVDALPERPGKSAVELFEAAARGEIKALWIACTNPAQSMPDQALVRRALEACELVILQDCFADTATAPYADVLLPAAGWGEKEGTVSNSERRISRVRAAIAPPGEARPDWQIVRDLAQHLEPLLRPGRPGLFEFERSEQLWLEHRAATLGRDLDIGGLSYALLDAQGPQQWPFPAGALRGQARLYQDGRFATPDGRARFIARPWQAPRDKIDAKYPLGLNTGRLREHWHGMSRSGQVPRLFGHEPRPLLRLNPQDMPRRGLADGDLVRLSSRRGEMVLAVQGDARVRPTLADLPMHWGQDHVSGRDSQGRPLLGVNALSQPAFCPDSRQPELKFTAVAVHKLDLPWRLSAAAWVSGDAVATVGRALSALLSEFDYAHCLPVAAPAGLPPEEGLQGWSLEAASAAPVAPELLRRIGDLLGLRGARLLRYVDGQRGRSRLALLDEGGHQARLRAVLTVGSVGEGAWVQALWRSAALAAPYGRRLLEPAEVDLSDAGPPAAAPSPQVCNCLDVSEARIRAQLASCAGSPAERLAALQQALACGTQCGSCLPALRRLERSTAPALVSSAPCLESQP
ncbi:molybdopterin-dependent oxidoreductase [Paucibacter sp. DJ2R-2]|uniref:nitrate reductase n=1 Tax=Paucibacter sp. DJ2R-2 TaxID=2893558 RepID=UPI0021E401CA|nr:molybdopterin-dependent oxidoreductase [Paucibacter sp. DJ2R-2]MCV2422031.1 molybdopterin-dependent oxidoreductase [Paucibacter sp. DJ4R-1]MCV2439352.1 molybdopterin-dependent oxidoreductase [Paucibacter sp. DJ2R-2]